MTASLKPRARPPPRREASSKIKKNLFAAEDRTPDGKTNKRPHLLSCLRGLGATRWWPNQQAQPRVVSRPGVLDNDKSSSKTTRRKRIRCPSSAAYKGSTTNICFYIFGQVPAGSGGPRKAPQGNPMGLRRLPGASRRPQAPTTTQTNKKTSQTQSIKQSSKSQEQIRTSPWIWLNTPCAWPTWLPS